MSRAPLVLLHGWGLGPAVWAPLMDCLPADRPVFAPPLPGHAGAPPAATHTLAAWANQIAAALPDAAAVCGWSLGGMLAMAIAQRHPAKVSRLLLVGTSPRFVAGAASDAAAWEHGLDAATVAAFIDGFRASPAETLRRFIALQVVGDANRRSVTAALNAAVPASGATDPHALAPGLEILASADLRSAAPQLRIPARLFHGAGDALMPLAAAEWLAAQLPAARLTVFADCGHAPFLSRPREFADALREALDE